MLSILFGVILGGALGAWIGWKGRCTTGTCPMTSNPYMGGIYGALVGGLVAGLWVQPMSSPSTEAASSKAAPPSVVTSIPETKVGGEEKVSTPTATLIHVTTTEALEKIIKTSPYPVLVDYWAIWCPPCRAQGKILKEMLDDVAGKVQIVKVDVDKAPRLARDHGIRSIPTLEVYTNGTLHKRVVGLQTREALERLLGLVPPTPTPD